MDIKDKDKNIQDSNSYQNAHSKAVAKYNKENYKTFSVNMKQEEYDRLCFVSGSCGVGKSRFLIDIFNNLNDEDIAKLISQYNDKG